MALSKCNFSAGQSSYSIEGLFSYLEDKKMVAAAARFGALADQDRPGRRRRLRWQDHRVSVDRKDGATASGSVGVFDGKSSGG